MQPNFMVLTNIANLSSFRTRKTIKKCLFRIWNGIVLEILVIVVSLLPFFGTIGLSNEHISSVHLNFNQNKWQWESKEQKTHWLKSKQYEKVNLLFNKHACFIWWLWLQIFQHDCFGRRPFRLFFEWLLLSIRSKIKYKIYLFEMKITSFKLSNAHEPVLPRVAHT